MKFAEFQIHAGPILERLRPLWPLLLALALPLLLGGTQYALDLAKIALLYALFAVSWDLFCGLTGESSFGHTFLIAAGAFAAALCQAHLGAPPWVGALAGALAGLGAGCLTGFLTLRQTGAVFAMVTMALQLTFHRTLFVDSQTFGGEEGVFIPSPLAPDPVVEYVVIALASAGALHLCLWLKQGRFGRFLRASGGDTRVGMASGVPVGAVRLLGAGLSGMLAGTGGVLLVHHAQVANHEIAGDAMAGLIFLLATAGGRGGLAGPWLVALGYITFFRESLVAWGKAEPVIAFGVLLAVVWAMPDGLAPRLARLALRAQGKFPPFFSR